MMPWYSSPATSEGTVNSARRKLERRHATTLKKYLADEREAVLEQAYGPGRQAIAMG